MTPRPLTQIAAIAGAVWIGGAAALVTSAEIDRRLHPLEYPLPYEIDLTGPAPAPDEDPASSSNPLAPVEPLAAFDACAI